MAGTDLQVDSTAVTVEISVSFGGSDNRLTDTTRYHEIEVDGQWRYSVSQDVIDGSC